jgi:DNA/RNA endonuclease G (NUC1)
MFSSAAGRASAHARRQFLSTVLAALLLLPNIFFNPGFMLTARADTNVSVSIPAFGTTVTQNFDTLVSAGTGTLAANTPAGWGFVETGTGGNTTYTAGTGSNNAGDTYSFGVAGTNPATDRAFGQLRSGTVVPVLGAVFANSTGGTINSLAIAYAGEQWRLGATGRTTAERMDFQYSTNATSLSTGTWTDADALDFNPTITSGTVGLLDGNAAANRRAISSTVTGLSIPAGATFWIRWTDVDATGADDGLAIDDFSITAAGTITPTPNLSINDVSLNEGDGGQTAFNFTVSLSSAAGAGGVNFNVDTADGTASAPGDYTAVHTSASIPQGATTVNVNVQVNGDTVVEPNETLFVNISNVSGANVTDAQGQGTILNDDAAPVATNVLVNEVDSDTPGTDTAEFVELYDGGVGNTPLDGLVVVFYNGSNDQSYAAFDLDGKTTDANGYFTLGNSGVAGVGLVFADGLLQNGADAVALYAANATNFPNNTPISIANLRDALVYDTSDADDAGLLALLNAGQPQVNEDATNGPLNSNQRCPSGSGGARNTSTYGQGAPTPGSANSCVPVAPPTSPTGAGSASPNALTAGSTTLLTVNVTPGTNPASTGLAVTADLSSIGGPAAQSFSGVGNIFTFTATVDAGASTGAKSLPFTVTDLEGRTGTGTISLTVIQPPPPVEHLVISQVYGGGGNSNATYRNDFVELYNPTQQTVNLHHWTLQYASDDGSGWDSNKVFLGGTVAPGEYYLVSLASGGATGNVLPAANVSGSVNMSGSNGKIALVSNLEGLEGASNTCPLDDPDLVDFVGYGSTANCGEGGTKAPTLGNTTAATRLNGGATDTDNNAADFTAATPNPHRTAPIVELGPVVIGTDPRSNGFNAPRDASLTVSFTEPVDIDTSSAWFHVACATTGVHDSATVAGGSTSFVITPNTNFANGEQCTATVFKNSVHDSDLDDSGPDSDTLEADYTWSFTTSTGTAPPYAPDVHLTLGNPSGAVADVGQPNNYLMEKPEFALSYSRDAGRPNWVSWHLSDEWVGTLTRVDTFRPDPAVPADWYRVLHTDYAGSGFDRGHMTPNADRDKETSVPINQATFLMSNMVPQAPDNNQGPWAAFESYLRTLLPANEIYIVSGPAGSGGTGSGGFATTIANGHVAVPSSTWKVALVLPKGTNDVSRVTAATRTIAINIPNVQGIRNVDWHTYLTTVDQVESMTGYDFFSNVPDAVENSIEAGTDGTNPPATAAQSLATAEDTPADITLAAASPSGGALTYFVTQPAHGTLSGTGATRTYTPAADYHGPDSFTFSVSDGTHTSNTSTVTVGVSEVNDAPEATGDLQTTQEDTPLVFAASDLTSNDNAGTPDESVQTLTVVSVTALADTHGTLALAAGQITYSPAPDFNNTAHFAYRVCDDGMTSGSPDPQCADATVTVTVTPVNDAPAAAADTLLTDEDMPATLDVRANDSDVDGDALSVSAVTQGAHGSVNVGGDGTLTYTPAPDFNGTDSFTYTVNDGHDATATAAVNVTVKPVNDAPTAVNDEDVTVVEDSGANTVLVLGNDTDVDGDALAVSAVTQGSHGSVVNNSSSVSYTPAADYNGSDSFTYTTTDGHGGTSTANVIVNVTPVNDAPVLLGVPASATVAELSPYTFTAQASDVDGQPLTFSLVGAPAGAAIDQAGVFNWTPTEAQGGTGSSYVFKVRVSDGVVNTESQVSLTVTEVNSAPLLAHIGDRTVALGGTLTFTAAGTDADLPAQALTYSLTGAYPAGASINATTGAFSWTPAAAQAGYVYTFGVRVTDNGAGALHADETINVGTGYTWSGVLQPVNPNGSSIFKLGRTVPVKFQLTGASAGITNAVARLYVAKVTDSVVGTEEEADSTSNATEGNLFRYSGGQYIFNLSTDGLTVGTYQLRIDLGDGVPRVVQVSLR